jgi:hypothetical protein
MQPLWRSYSNVRAIINIFRKFEAIKNLFRLLRVLLVLTDPGRYNLYYADVPFNNPCVLAMYEAIQQDEFKFPDVATSGRELPSPELQNLIRILLVKDYEKRAKLTDVMNHR